MVLYLNLALYAMIAMKTPIVCKYKQSWKQWKWGYNKGTDFPLWTTFISDLMWLKNVYVVMLYV